MLVHYLSFNDRIVMILVSTLMFWGVTEYHETLQIGDNPMLLPQKGEIIKWLTKNTSWSISQIPCLDSRVMTLASAPITFVCAKRYYEI